MHGEFVLTTESTGELVHQCVFLGENRGGTPHGSAHVAAERPLDGRNHFVADSVARETEIGVRWILMEGDLAFTNERVDLVAPDREQGAPHVDP
jgi:hypothetical protein